MKSRDRRAERMSEFVTTSMFQSNVTMGITRSDFFFCGMVVAKKKLWNAGISMFRQVDVMKVVQEGTQTSSKLKVVVSTKRALAEAFLNLQPVIVKADEDFEQTRQPFQSKACQRVGEMLSGWLSAVMCRNLSWCCKALNYVEMNTRGVGECARVGDRFLAPIQRCLNKWLLENVVEGLRSGIQTSFYTCDYTTKPALTCGPMLRHLTVGMQRLEEQMQMELETAECQRLLEVYPVADQKPVPTVSPEAREARKRLCRLWTSANHAVMHGHCLMAIHLLTGREVIRSHVFWRLMMKRVIWGIFQQVSSHRGGTEDDGEQELGLNDVALGLVSAETDDPTGLAQAATTPGEVRADLSYENDGSVELRTTSFYEDYLHRGDVEPLKSMNFYVYGMYVSCVHVQQLGDRITHVAEFDFVPHYNKARFYVQVLHKTFRIPYLHGITPPTKEKDPEMWAAVHLGLLRRHHCLGSAKCGHPDGVLAHVRKMPRSKRSRVVIGGTDRRRVEDPTGLLTEWRATEAEMQTLAKRATVSGLQVQFFEWF